MKRLLIIGAGGFGQMIQETAGLLGYDEAVFLDDASKHKDVVGKCCDYKNFLEDYDTCLLYTSCLNWKISHTKTFCQ